MTYEEKLAMIEATDAPEAEKAKMRQMITLGDEVHQEASAFIQAEYGLDEEDLANVQSVGSALLTNWGEGFILGLGADSSLNDDDRRRIVSAVMDYVKITMRNYWRAKKESGLSGD